jgi:hypothetical protein
LIESFTVSSLPLLEQLCYLLPIGRHPWFLGLHRFVKVSAQRRPSWRDIPPELRRLILDSLNRQDSGSYHAIFLRQDYTPKALYSSSPFVALNLLAKSFPAVREFDGE